MNNIFEQQEIVIRLEQPLDYTAFIRMIDYLDATKALIKTTKSSKGEDTIYYVDCPNCSQHGSDSQTATMIFAQEGEKNPIFLCHHVNTCKDLTFQDFINFHSTVNPLSFVDDGTLLEYQLSGQSTDHSIHRNSSSDTEEQQELANEISFYGYDYENNLYFGNTDSFMLLKYKPAEISEKNCYAILSDQNKWLLAFSDMKQKSAVMYWNNASEWLIRKSKQAGPFKARNVRLLGIHKEKDGFVLNTGTNCLLQNGKTLSYHEIRDIYKKSLYFPASNDINISKYECSNIDIDDLLSIIKKWPFRSEFDHIKFLGVLICGMVPGGLEIRPSGWLTAESGSGKTQVFTYIISVIWKASGAVIADKGTSAAGIEAASKGSNVSVAHDEAEATSDSGIKKIAAVVDQVLSSSTNGTGETYKSNPHGHTLSYKSQSCYLFGSIGDKVDNPTLKRRIATFSLIGKEEPIYKNHYAPNWNNLKHETKEKFTEEFAGSLFLYIFNRLDKLNSNIELVEKYLTKNSSVGSEIIGLYSAIFGAYLSIKYKFNVDESSLDCLQEYIKILEHDNTNSDSERSTGAIMINSLFDIGVVRTQDNKNIYIADLISVVLGYDNFNNPIGFTISNAIDMLAKCGIKVVPADRCIIISNTNQWMKSFFERLGHTNHSSRLKTYPGARPTDSPIHFYKSGSSRGVIIPLSEEFFINTGNITVSRNAIFETECIIFESED